MSLESRIADVEGRIAAVPPAPMLGAPDAADSASGESFGGDFGGGGESDRAGAFQLENGKFVNCHFMFGRHVYSISDQAVGEDGTYCLVIPHADPSNASVVSSSQPSDDNKTVIPLITVIGGVIMADYRGMPYIATYE